MRFSLTSLIRLAFYSALGLTSMAWALAGVSRPRPEIRRNASPVRYVGLNANLYAPNQHRLNLLDRVSGEVRAMSLPEGDDVDFVSMSPWRDDNGNHQVIGRWSERRGQDILATKGEFGLVRMTFPAGEVLDRLSLDILPVSTPCWFPGSEARILFGSGDGKLYTFSFESKTGETLPREIAWGIPKPGLADVFLAEPTWLETKPGAHKRLAVSIRMVENKAGKPRYSNSKIWWLELGADDEAIVAAGQLVPDGPDSESTDLRSPMVSRSSEGPMRLAYLKAGTLKQWELLVTDLEAPAQGTGPVLARRPGRALAENCLPMPPAFSEDGRTLSTMKGEIFKGGRIVRVSLDPERQGLAAADREVVLPPH